MDYVKAKKIMTVLTAVLAANFVLPIFASAESLDSLNEKESTITRQSDQISAEVQMTLNDVNDKYAEMQKAKEELAASEQKIAKTQKEITETEKNIASRKKLAAKRLQDIQVNGGVKRDWTVLLESSNVQDFVNRAYAMTVLQNAEKEKITTLNDEREKLQSLKASMEKSQTALKENEAALEAESKELDAKIANLKEQLAANQNSLQQIAKSKEAEQSRLAAEKARKEQEAKEQAEAEKAAADKQQAAQESTEASSQESSTGSSSSNNESSASSEKPEASKPSTGGGSTSGGRTMIMESTAYSYSEPGASYFTASGTDLRKNPVAIAVDPSVIPLGTVCEVQGYGIAVALDTGGAIKGNIVDVHFKTVDECINWGRRQVKVTIQ